MSMKITSKELSGMLKTAYKENVTVLPGVFRERMSLNRAYLIGLDSQCLLQNFYLEAGIIIPGRTLSILYFKPRGKLVFIIGFPVLLRLTVYRILTF